MSTKQIVGIIEAFYNGASVENLASDRSVPESLIEDLIRAYAAGQKAKRG